MKFVLASHNKGKLAEMQAVLAELGIEVVMPAELGIDVDVEETGETFAENAALKAKAIMAASGLPAIADDSGLCVNWLNGAPGVYSARYGGLDDDAARYRLLLQNLRGATDRSAYFHTAIVCAFPNGDVLTAEGDCHGAIAFAPWRRRLRLRSGVSGAVPAQDLRPADARGEERHLSPGQRPADICGGAEGISDQ